MVVFIYPGSHRFCTKMYLCAGSRAANTRVLKKGITHAPPEYGTVHPPPGGRCVLFLVIFVVVLLAGALHHRAFCKAVSLCSWSPVSWAAVCRKSPRFCHQYGTDPDWLAAAFNDSLKFFWKWSWFMLIHATTFCGAMSIVNVECLLSWSVYFSVYILQKEKFIRW